MVHSSKPCELSDDVIASVVIVIVVSIPSPALLTAVTLMV